MAAPKFVPVAPTGAFRDAEDLPVPDGWTADRPAEIHGGAPTGRQMGRPGPDQGYALKLASRFHGKLRLAPGEHEHDVIAGCLGVALKRAASYGRAPVIHDLELAFTVFGFTLEDAPADLVRFRTPLFEAAGHHYELQRAIADMVADETLRKTPSQVRAQVLTGQSAWRKLLISAEHTH